MKKKEIQIGKEEAKASLFVGNKVIYLKKIKKSLNKLLDLNKWQCSKKKVKIQIVLLYTSMNNSKIKI